MVKLADPEDSLLSHLRKLKMLLKQEMQWLIQSLTVKRFELISPLLNVPTLLHLESTWEDQRAPVLEVEVAETIVIGTGDLQVPTTEGGRLPQGLVTEGPIDPDRDPTLHVVITDQRGMFTIIKVLCYKYHVN